MKRRSQLALVLLGGLTLAHFDFGLPDAWPRLLGLPGALVWHVAFCLVASGVYWVLAGRVEDQK